MNLSEMPRWAAGNIGEKIGYAAADAATYVIDDLVPTVMTAVMRAKDFAADKATSAATQVKDKAMAAIDRKVEGMTEKQFDRVMVPVALIGGLAIVAKDRIDSLTSRINERRTK